VREPVGPGSSVEEVIEWAVIIVVVVDSGLHFRAMRSCRVSLTERCERCHVTTCIT